MQFNGIIRPREYGYVDKSHLKNENSQAQLII